MIEAIPVRSLVRFTATFTQGGKPYDPRGITAKVRVGASQPQRFALDSGIARIDAGVYRVDVRLDQAGEGVIEFATDSGDDQRERFTVVERQAELALPAAAAPAFEWPDGYDRASALAKLRFDARDQPDSFVRGALVQQLKGELLHALERHDDRRPLPSRDLEVRARNLAAARLPGADSIEKARADIRRDTLGRR